MSNPTMRALALGLVATWALAGLTAGASAAETIAINIKGMAFSPATIAAHVGDTIVWTNQDFVQHTATATDKTWDVVIPAGKTGSLVLTTAGAIDYFCRFHPNMKAKLDVTK